MEIRVYTIKVDPPRYVKTILLYVLLPVTMFLSGAMAVRASVELVTFQPNTPIKSNEVNQNFERLKDAIEGLQASSALLFGVAGEPATVTNDISAFSYASCGDKGRVVTGFCVTDPLQPLGQENGLWKWGAHDRSINVADSPPQPPLGGVWVCDIKANSGSTVRAYAICMNAP